MQLELFTDMQDMPATQKPVPAMTIPIEEIFQAYYECRKHKRNRSGAMQFEVDLEKNLVDLWQEINNGTWEPKPSTVFIVHKPVTREIFAAAFRDRIIHHLVISKLNPLFEKSFIHDSYSCRLRKGTHFGINRAQHFIRQCSQNNTIRAWILKIDIRGYFMSIDRNILHTKLTFFIDNQYQAPDKELIKELCRIIIFNDPTKDCIRHSPLQAWSGLPPDKSLFSSKNNCGLPIGNLTSQIFANFYLNEFDHYIKKQCGIAYYGRYVDDCIIIHNSRHFLKKLIPQLHRYLLTHLGLLLLLAYKAIATDHKPDKVETSAFISSVNSYLGIMKHYKTYKKRKIILQNQISPFWHKHITLALGYGKIMIKGKP
jgi:retron-type reverse transcriptase